MTDAGALAALVSTRHEYDHVFSIYVPIAVGVIAVVYAAVIIAVLVFHRRRRDHAARWHENNLLEGSYAVLLTCVAAFLLYVTFGAEHKVDTVANRQRPSLVVNVTGSKWVWTFSYPAYGFNVRSGTIGIRPFVVPAGEAVRINLISSDVIHSFWVPAVRYKHDAIPGSTQVTTLTFARGDFAGQCAEFCGLRHSDMLFTVHAVSPAQFQAWARSKGTAPAP